MCCLFLCADVIPVNIPKRKKILKEEVDNATDDLKKGVSIRKTFIKYGSTLRHYKLNEQKKRKNWKKKNNEAKHDSKQEDKNIDTETESGDKDILYADIEENIYMNTDSLLTSRNYWDRSISN